MSFEKKNEKKKKKQRKKKKKPQTNKQANQTNKTNKKNHSQKITGTNKEQQKRDPIVRSASYEHLTIAIISTQ
jgi:hypothetical protein